MKPLFVSFFFVLLCDKSRKNISWWAYFLGFFKWMWLLMDSKLVFFFWLFQIKIILVVNFSFFNKKIGKMFYYHKCLKWWNQDICFNISLTLVSIIIAWTTLVWLVYGKGTFITQEKCNQFVSITCQHRLLIIKWCIIHMCKWFTYQLKPLYP